MNADAGPTRRVAVVGAGIIGATVPLELQRQGMAVTLIDKGEPGMECSFGNGGAISPDFCVPSSLPGMLRRVPGWFADPLGPLVVRWGRLPAALPWLVRWIRAGRLEKVLAASAALRALHAPSLGRYATLLGAEAQGQGARSPAGFLACLAGGDAAGPARGRQRAAGAQHR